MAIYENKINKVWNEMYLLEKRKIKPILKRKWFKLKIIIIIFLYFINCVNLKKETKLIYCFWCFIISIKSKTKLNNKKNKMIKINLQKLKSI